MCVCVLVLVLLLFLVGAARGKYEKTVAFPEQRLKLSISTVFFVPNNLRRGAHLKNFGKCPKMLCFCKNFRKNSKKCYK